MMGNAVRLAKKNSEKSTDMQPTFCVPRKIRSNASMKCATVVSGEKNKLSEKAESSKIIDEPLSVQDSGHLRETHPTWDSKVMVNRFAETKHSSLFATAGHETVAAIERSRQNILLQDEKTPSVVERPRAEVKYIVLQPGQKMTDLLHLNSGQEFTEGAGQPQILYLGHLNKTPPRPVTLYSHPPSASPGTDTTGPTRQFPGPVSSSPSLLPSLEKPASDTALPASIDRPKDIVPGTEDKYRTPGSSFLNKKGNIKRPMNAFMVWARSYRSTLASQYHGDTNSQISIKLGDVWNSLTPEEKKPYYDEAERIKNQHKREFPGWVYRPSPTKKRLEDAATHHLLWARFAGGSSSATLAAMATAAANQRPLHMQTVQLKQELLSCLPVRDSKCFSTNDNKNKPAQPVTEPKRVSDEHTLFPTESKEQTTGTSEHTSRNGLADEQASPQPELRPQQPTPATLDILKAKLHSVQKSPGTASESGNVNCARKTKSQPKASKKTPKPKGEVSQNNAPRVPVKKRTSKKCSPGIGSLDFEGKERVVYPLDLRPMSPVTPPPTPRSDVTASSHRTTDSLDSTTVNKMEAGVRTEPARETDGAVKWTDPNSEADDSLARTLTRPEYSPFSSLSPRDVPSDDILGPGKRVLGCSEDLARPERVTSDMYLNVNGWNSLLTSTESTTELTDDDVCQMFNPKQCQHGESCTVCSSDLDLAPKSVKETLLARFNPQNIPNGESGHDNTNYCVEVEMIEAKLGPLTSEVDEITNSVMKSLLNNCNSGQTFNKRPAGIAKNLQSYVDNSEANEDGTSSVDLEQDYNQDDVDAGCNRSTAQSKPVDDGCPMVSGSESQQQSEHDCELNASSDSDVSSEKETVAVLPDQASSSSGSVEGEDSSATMETDLEYDVQHEPLREGFLDVSLSPYKTTHVVFKDHQELPTRDQGCNSGPDFTHRCIGCALNINDYEAVRKIDKYALSSISNTDTSLQASGKQAGYTRQGASSVCPRASTSMFPQVYKTGCSSKEQDLSQSVLAPEIIPIRPREPNTSVQSAMYHRNIQLQKDISKYKIFDTNESAKPEMQTSAELAHDRRAVKLEVFGEKIQSSSSWPKVDTLEDVDSREELLSGTEGSGECKEMKVPFARRKSRGKKKGSKQSAVRDTVDSSWCQGDSVAKKNYSKSVSTGEQLELMRSIMVQPLDKEKQVKDISFIPNMYNQFSWSRHRRLRMRSHIMSKTYLEQQTLPELPNKKKSKAGGRKKAVKSSLSS